MVLGAKVCLVVVGFVGSVVSSEEVSSLYTVVSLNSEELAGTVSLVVTTSLVVGGDDVVLDLTVVTVVVVFVGL